MQAVIEMSTPGIWGILACFDSDRHRQTRRFGGSCDCSTDVSATVQPYTINGFWVSGVRALFALTVRNHPHVFEMSNDLKLVK